MTKSKKVKLRKARLDDIEHIHSLIMMGAKTGAVLERSRQDILENLRDFWVAETPDGEVVGTLALHFVSPSMCEVKSFVVKPSWQGMGIGRKLLNRAVREARAFGFKEVFVLATKPEIYERMGFTHIQKEKLPHKVWRECINCPKFPQCDEEAYVKKLVKGKK